MREIIRDLVFNVVEDTFGKGLKVKNATFEEPKRKEFGNYSTNIAFLLSKQLSMKPIDIANKLSEKLSSFDVFEKVDVAGGGFINFFIGNDLFSRILKEVLQKDFYVQDMGKGQRVLVEHTSANPTGPLHVGHGRGAVVGDVLSNILKMTGYKVEREFYINDAGRQIKILGKSIYAKAMELNGKSYPLNERYKGDYIADLAKQALSLYPNILSVSEDKAVEVLSDFGKRRMLERIKGDLERLRICFDNWFSEKSLYKAKKVERTIGVLKQKGLIYEKEGALWLKTTKFGDDKDRVIRKNDGEYTYFASDIAYHLDKMERGFDKAVDVWGADHHGYIPRMKAVVKAFGKEGDWLEVVLVQLVKLIKGGEELKMSKREGNFVPLKWLMDEVGVDAVRFFFLLKRHDTPLDFDLDLAVSKKSENPVYYVQYAYARMCSVVEKAAELGIEPSDNNLHLLSSDEEKDLIMACYNFKSQLAIASRRREPHRIAYYLIDLSSKLHRFYNKYRVIDESNLELSSARLILINAVKTIVKAGLDIINVSAPRRM